MKRFTVRKVAAIIVLVACGIMVFSGIVMLLWNALMPTLFHLPVISFWQALGLMILAKILFGGFRGPGNRPRWKEKMQDRWMNMSQEEKEKFMQKWGPRCRTPFDKGDRFSADRFSTDRPGTDRSSTERSPSPETNPSAE